MRISKRSRTRGGFTLIELMITVALIGTLAAIAIPNFLTFQARSRRSEGYSNVAGIARAFKAYHADRGRFPDMLTETTALGGAESSLPDPSAYGMSAPSTVKLPWDAATESFFKIVGWRPDGNVFYTYDVRSVGCASPCTDQSCFTVTAHGDVDNDLQMAALMYVHPILDASGAPVAECNSRVFNYPPPVRAGSGNPVYDEVAIRLNIDHY
jgi:prepilin-type N-terminal cleavage/methylation domain-containing protein